MNDFLDFSDLNLDENSEFIFNQDNQSDKEQENITPDNDINNDELNNNQESENKDTQKENIKPNSTPSDDSSNTDDSAILVFARMLNEEGVLPFDEESLNNIKSVEDLKEQISSAINKHIEDKKFEGLNDSQKRFLGAIEAGIPKTEFDELEKNLSIIERLSPEVLEQDDKARFNIIAMSYIQKGFPKEKAIKMANASFQMQTDIEDAVEARDLLYNDLKTKYENTIEDKKEQHRISVEQLKTKIDETENVLGNLRLTPKMKDDVYKSMITKVDTDDNGLPLNSLDKWIKENPIDSKIILHTLKVATNNFKDLGRLGTVAKNKAISQLEDKLKQSENLQFNKSVKFNGLDLDINV